MIETEMNDLRDDVEEFWSVAYLMQLEINNMTAEMEEMQEELMN